MTGSTMRGVLSLALLAAVITPGEVEQLDVLSPAPPEPGLGPGEVLYTVPWVPQAEGAHVRGRVVRAVQLAAKLAIEAGWSAEALRQRPHWHEHSARAACVRLAVEWGLIP